MAIFTIEQLIFRDCQKFTLNRMFCGYIIEDEQEVSNWNLTFENKYFQGYVNSYPQNFYA